MIPKGRSIIETYGEGGFRISGTRYEGSVIVLADKVLPWLAHDWKEFPSHSFMPLFLAALESSPVELLLLGTGARMDRLPSSLKEELKQRGIGSEAMDTGAACRTYNVLAAEGRYVAAALIAVS